MMVTTVLILVSVAVATADDCYMKNTEITLGAIDGHQTNTFDECKAWCRLVDECQAVVWGGIWPLDRQCTLKKLGVFLQVEIWNPLFTSAKKPCITQEGECPAGQFKPAGHRVDCKTCPAGSYSKAGASSCTKCPAGLYSKEGAGSCSNCYKSKTENVKMNTNGVEKGTSFEAAAAACVIDDRCDGVTCMKKGKDKCFTGVGMGSSKSKKWYSFEKDC